MSKKTKQPKPKPPQQPKPVTIYRIVNGKKVDTGITVTLI